METWRFETPRVNRSNQASRTPPRHYSYRTNTDQTNITHTRARKMQRQKYDLAAILQSTSMKQHLSRPDVVNLQFIQMLPNLCPQAVPLSSSIAARIRESPSRWSDLSPKGDAFFKQIKADLNLLLEERMIKSIDDMKITQPHFNAHSIGIAIPVGSVHYEDEHTFGIKTTATRRGHILIRVSLSLNEYIIAAVLFPQEATCPNMSAAQNLLSLSARK